jgi:hypothetical protein
LGASSPFLRSFFSSFSNTVELHMAADSGLGSTDVLLYSWLARINVYKQKRRVGM